MEADPTRMCALLVGLPDVTVLGVVDEKARPPRFVVQSRCRRVQVVICLARGSTPPCRSETAGRGPGRRAVHRWGGTHNGRPQSQPSAIMVRRRFWRGSQG